MSTFHALNVSSDEEELEAEEYSRESQIEESVQIFQDALKLMKVKDFEGANAKFELLFQMDVIKPDKWGLYRSVSPTLNNLRYLAHRNRGIYYFVYLSSNYETMETDNIAYYIIQAIDHLMESIQHSEADITVTTLLYKIFDSFKSKKLEREILEYEMTKEENQMLLSGRSSSTILPQLKNVIRQYTTLLKGIKATSSLEYHVQDDMGLDALHEIDKNTKLFQVIKSIKTNDENTLKDVELETIELEEMSWEAIAVATEDLLPKTKMSTLITKGIDPYTELESSIEAVNIHVAETQTISEENESNLNDKTGTRVTPNATEQAPNEIEDDFNSKKRVLDSADTTRHQPQRSSKRFKEKDTDGKGQESMMEKHTSFVNSLGDVFRYLNIDLPGFLHTLPLSLSSMKEDVPLPYHDLFQCLKNWSSWHTEQFMRTDFTAGKSNGPETDELIELSSLLRSDPNQETKALEGQKQLPIDVLKDFINTINERKPHFHEFRYNLLHILLSRATGETERKILLYTWSPNLFESVESLNLGVERSILDYMEQTNDIEPYLVLSIIELLINRMGYLCSEISAKESQGQKSNELKHQKSKLERRIQKWTTILDAVDASEVNWTIQYRWIQYCFMQFKCEAADHKLLTFLCQLEELIKKANPNLEVTYTNYKYIPNLNLNYILKQIHRVKIIQNIMMVYSNNDSENSTSKQEQQISHIENLLLESLYPDMSRIHSKNDQEIVSFITASPFTIQLRLWEMIFNMYHKKGDVSSLTRVFFHILLLLQNNLASSDYKQSTTELRHRLLLTIITSVGDFSEKLNVLISRNNKESGSPLVTDNQLTLLNNIFCLCCSVLIFERLSEIDPLLDSFFTKAVKSSTKMKEIIINLATLLVHFLCDRIYRNMDTHQEPNSMVIFIEHLHSLFGEFQFCDASNSIFLKVSEKFLCSNKVKIELPQLKQILWCLYHFTITGDLDDEMTHSTVPCKMERESALRIGIYLLTTIPEHRTGPLLAISNSSIKLILERVIEEMGPPLEFPNYNLSRNIYQFNSYLDKPLSTQLFRDSFSNLSSFKLIKPNNELQHIIENGIFYWTSSQSLKLALPKP